MFSTFRENARLNHRSPLKSGGLHFLSFYHLKIFWDGLPVFEQQTMYHVHTEMRQSLGKNHYFDFALDKLESTS